MKIEVKDLLDLNYTISKDLFKNITYPYEVLKEIKNYIIELGEKLDKNNYNKINNNIWISKSATISDKATIIGPCIIDDFTEIRPGAYIRGNAIIGKKCVIGNSTEIKNSIIFDNCQIPHYNYVGDSILGYHSHLGAGVILSNLKSDRSNIIINKKDTNLYKMGAIIGDYAEIGCNSVLCPGTIIGKGSTVYPLVRIRGIIEENKIVKDIDNIVEKRIINE